MICDYYSLAAAAKWGTVFSHVSTCSTRNSCCARSRFKFVHGGLQDGLPQSLFFSQRFHAAWILLFVERASGLAACCFRLSDRVGLFLYPDHACPFHPQKTGSAIQLDVCVFRSVHSGLWHYSRYGGVDSLACQLLVVWCG